MSKSQSSHYIHSDKGKRERVDELNTALLAKMNDFCAYCKVDMPTMIVLL